MQIESFWPSLFAKLLEKRNIEDLILNVGSGGGAAVAVAAPAGGAPADAAPAVEEKKKVRRKESVVFVVELRGGLFSALELSNSGDLLVLFCRKRLRRKVRMKIWDSACLIRSSLQNAQVLWWF